MKISMVNKKRHVALSPVNLRLFPQGIVCGQHTESVTQSRPRVGLMLEAGAGSVYEPPK